MWALIAAVAAGAKTPALATASLVLFILAAVGGFVLLSFFARKRRLPTPLVFAYGIAAVAGLLLLLAAKLGA